MRGRFKEGWYRDEPSAFPDLVIKVTRPAGPGLSFMTTPFDRGSFGHPVGAGNRLTKADWERMVSCDPPAWADGTEFDEVGDGPRP